MACSCSLLVRICPYSSRLPCGNLRPDDERPGVSRRRTTSRTGPDRACVGACCPAAGAAHGPRSSSSSASLPTSSPSRRPWFDAEPPPASSARSGREAPDNRGGSSVGGGGGGGVCERGQGAGGDPPAELVGTIVRSGTGPPLPRALPGAQTACLRPNARPWLSASLVLWPSQRRLQRLFGSRQLLTVLGCAAQVCNAIDFGGFYLYFVQDYVAPHFTLFGWHSPTVPWLRWPSSRFVAAAAVPFRLRFGTAKRLFSLLDSRSALPTTNPLRRLLSAASHLVVPPGRSAIALACNALAPALERRIVSATLRLGWTFVAVAETDADRCCDRGRMPTILITQTLLPIFSASKAFTNVRSAAPPVGLCAVCGVLRGN